MAPDRDTDLGAQAAQLATYRRMPAADRVALALSMSEEARCIAADGIRARHPEYTETDVTAAVRRLL